MSTGTMGTSKKSVFYRGPRPVLRGYIHLFAFWYFAGTGTSLTVTSFANSGLSGLSVATAVYAFCLAGMLGVSAMYHRFPWKSEGAVQHWRRADHSMIAIFIAGTYGPIFIGAHMGGKGLLLIAAAWVLSILAVVVNLVWIEHPRWLSAGIYLALGWTAVIGISGLVSGLSTAELVLILVGGAVYSIGAIGYALKWPTISRTWFGFHEVFHAGTIIAAGLHHIAIWMIVLNYH